MEVLSEKNYTFGRFEFDAERLVLYHDGTLVKEVEKRSLQVLSVLLSRAGDPVSHEEIIGIVWSDNPHGATSTRVNQYISRLRKTLAALDPEKTYIETLIGRGYSFVHEVSRSPEPVVRETAAGDPAEDRGSVPPNRRRYTWLYMVVAVVALAAITAGYWKYGRTDDVEEIKRVVKESQMYESLVLYRSPEDFKEEMLDRYWLSENDGQANFDRGRIRQAVKKLITEGRHYGEQSECTIFEFDKVEVGKNRDVATVRTFEKWSLDDITKETNASKKRIVGPYFVDYILRKVNGRWMIEKSSTARTVRPVPQLQMLELTRGERSEWLINVFGSDLEARTLYFEIQGVDCTRTRPCRIDNHSLRERSIISSDSVINIPVELAPGEYQIFARNGDSAPSGPLTFNIP